MMAQLSAGHRRKVRTLAGKGKNFKPFGNKSSGKSNLQKAFDSLGQPPRKSKGQDGRKVHDTKGKNTHGRRR